jgi:AraC-like DNA-binding protein
MKQPVMDLCIRTTANEVIPLESGFPAGSSVHGIAESDKWHAQGGFGTILVEVFNVGPCTIRLFTIRTVKKLSLTISTVAPAICARIATGSSWHFSLGGTHEIKMLEGQYTLYRLNGSKEKIIFEKGREYRSFDVIYPVSKFEGVQQIFPGIEEYIDTSRDGSMFYLKKPGRVSAEIMDVVRGIPECPYGDTLREFYLKNKLDLLIFLMLTLAFKNEPEEDEPTAKEIEAAEAAKKIILSDITIHHSIPEIARQVKLNEFRLKYVFRYIYKTGVFEYLLQARMEAAKRMLVQTDFSIKEIAERTGYQSQSSFIGAFRKHFGYTPGSVRRHTITMKAPGK